MATINDRVPVSNIKRIGVLTGGGDCPGIVMSPSPNADAPAASSAHPRTQIPGVEVADDFRLMFPEGCLCSIGARFARPGTLQENPEGIK